MDITQLLLNSLGDDGLKKLSANTGLDQSTAASALSAAVPTLLSAMAKNTQDKRGADNLLSALDRDHDGGILDNLSGFLDHPETGNGAGILKHIFSEQRPQVETALASKAGGNTAGVSKLLEIAAPLVMAYLGREKKQSGGMDSSAITSILSSLTGDSKQSGGLDIGDILNVVGGLSGGGSQKSSRGGGIGGLLRGLFSGRR